MNQKRIAHIAGAIYLVVVITGMFSLAYVPSQLVVYKDAELTFRNILGNEGLFRMGIACSAICYTAFTFLPIILEHLLKTVHVLCAKVMTILAIISVPISFINLHNKFSILSLISGVKQGLAPAREEVYLKAMMYLNQYDNGIFIATVFWGLWLLPFGYLVIKSGFLPRILGILLMLGCAGYLANFLGNTISAEYAKYTLPKYLRLLPAIAEIGICFWLLIIGTKTGTKTL